MERFKISNVRMISSGELSGSKSNKVVDRYYHGTDGIIKLTKKEADLVQRLESESDSESDSDLTEYPDFTNFIMMYKNRKTRKLAELLYLY